MAQTGSTQGVSVINVNDTNNDAKQAAAHLWLGKESDGLDLELPIRTLLYEPKRNDLLKHLTAKTRFDLTLRFLKVVVIPRTLTPTLLTSPALALTTWTRPPRSSARKTPGFVGLMGEAYKVLEFSESEDLVENSKVWNRILSNNILWLRNLKLALRCQILDIVLMNNFKRFNGPSGLRALSQN